MTWGGRQMGAGRRVACAHCGDPLPVQPNELDALEHGDVRCPRCGRALNANDLFREMTTASAFTQLQLTSNWWEADQI
jgi:DNA-directed RNA polymerase subunit RPC12/RpoP